MNLSSEIFSWALTTAEDILFLPLAFLFVFAAIEFFTFKPQRWGAYMAFNMFLVCFCMPSLFCLSRRALLSFWGTPTLARAVA